MSETVLSIWLFCICYLIIHCNSSSSQCTDDICESKETLGQKLIRKQTDFYHLNSPTYREDAGAIGIKFHNPNDEVYDMYWYDPHRRIGIYKGKLPPKQLRATNSYVSHIFYFTQHGHEDQEVHRITVTKGVNDYLMPPTDKAKNDPFYKKFKEKETFYANYKKETGRPWLSGYKRPPPITHMWDANQIGQIHSIKSNNSFWYCIPDKTLTSQQQIEQCQAKNEVQINIEVISINPKMYVIENIISDTEADLVRNLATPKLHRSGTGQAGDANYGDETRTSRTAWLAYNEHEIIKTIYRRTADILQMEPDTLRRNAEYLQTVYYETGQEYKAHHDFADGGIPESRYITILFYLIDQLDEYSGGETWFPKARDGKGIKAHPGKGNAVLFYDLLEDGNGDDLTLHEAVKVKNGTKWICNFWVWDPNKRF